MREGGGAYRSCPASNMYHSFRVNTQQVFIQPHTCIHTVCTWSVYHFPGTELPRRVHERAVLTLRFGSQEVLAKIRARHAVERAEDAFERRHNNL